MTEDITKLSKLDENAEPEGKEQIDIKEIANEVNADTSGSALSLRLKQIFGDYMANSDIVQLRNSLSELMIFQKVSLNPLSHSTGYTPMTTSHEVYRSIDLLLKLEEQMNKLVGRDIYSY